MPQVTSHLGGVTARLEASFGPLENLRPNRKRANYTGAAFCTNIYKGLHLPGPLRSKLCGQTQDRCFARLGEAAVGSGHLTGAGFQIGKKTV